MSNVEATCCTRIARRADRLRLATHGRLNRLVPTCTERLRLRVLPALRRCLLVAQSQPAGHRVGYVAARLHVSGHPTVSR